MGNLFNVVPMTYRKSVHLLSRLMPYPAYYCVIAALCHFTQTSCDHQVKVAEIERVKYLSTREFQVTMPLKKRNKTRPEKSSGEFQVRRPLIKKQSHMIILEFRS